MAAVRASSGSDVPTQKIVQDTNPLPNHPYPDLTGQIRLLEQHYIAAGGFSYIYKGEWSDPAKPGRIITVAIKVLRGSGYTGNDIQRKLKQRLERESRIWQSFTHPNVLPFLGLVTDAAFGAVVPALVSPYCERKSVLEYLEKHEEMKRKPIIIGIARGLHFFHSRNAVHGDLKAANVLMSATGEPLLADFGRSKVVGHSGYTTEFACVWRYLAPEIMDDAASAYGPGDEDSRKQPITTKETDIWAFGLVGVEVLAAEVVFPKQKQHINLIMHIAQGGKPEKRDYKRLVHSEADAIWPVLEKCWAPEPKDRASMYDILRTLGDK